MDIGVVRLVANVVEKDLRRDHARACAPTSRWTRFPGETFVGRVAHVAPVLDPATRTAQIEIEIANAQFRLKPGMYAQGRLHGRASRDNALVVPTNALVDVGGQTRRVPATPTGDSRRSFKPIDVGIVDQKLTEVTEGLDGRRQVVTTGAAALREGDRILLPGNRPAAAAAAARQAEADAGGQGSGERPSGRTAARPGAARSQRPRLVSQ